MTLITKRILTFVFVLVFVILFAFVINFATTNETETAFALTGKAIGSTSDLGVEGTKYSLSSGNYYLSNNIGVSNPITIPSDATVTLDLNGYMIYDSNPSLIIDIFSINGNLTITDSYQGTDRKHEVNNVNTDEEGDKRTIVGGVIGEGNVNVNNGGNFTLNGGTISGSKKAVEIEKGGCFTMNGGTIMGNKGTDSSSGGSSSVGIPTPGGGSMGSGEAVINGAAVHNLGTFTMTGGTITENCGGPAVYSDIGSTFNISGSPKISGNEHSNCETLNTINIVGNLTQGAEICVMRTYYNKDGVVTGYTQSEPMTDYFASDSYGRCFYNDNGTLKIGDHILNDDGTCERCGQWYAARLDNLAYDTFEDAIEALNNTKNSFSMKMYTDGVLTSQLSTYSDTLSNARNITLDLNGHMLSAEGFEGSVFRISSGSLKINDTYTGTDRRHTVNGTEIIGGVITGGNGTLVDGNRLGGCVYISGSGSFTMNGGTICGNSATYGGGVYVGGGNTFRLNGGTICGNSATYGGGVYVNNATRNIGITITSTLRIASTNDNSVRAITNNTATYGGGVYVDGIFKLDANVNITNNKDGFGKNAKENNVYLAVDKKITVSSNVANGISKIGLSFQQSYSGAFTDKYNPKDENGNIIPPSTYFVSDDATKSCVYLDESNQAVMEEHTGGTASCSQKAICDRCANEYGEFAEHTFGEWQEGALPTCIATGTKAHKDCTLCGKHFDNDGNEIVDITIAVDENAHNFGEWQDETLPTCTTVGTKAHKDCTLCGKHFDNEDNEIVDITIAVDENAHNFGEWQDETLPTCTTVGTKAHKDCTLCEKHFDSEDNEIVDITIAVDENAHAFGEWTTTTEPTCTIKGEEQRVCLHNGEHIEKRELDALGHNLVQHEGKTPTCTEIGWEAYETCSHCDYTTYVELDSLGHTFGEWQEGTLPTCATEGTKAHKDCTLCGKHFDSEDNEIVDLTIAIDENAHAFGEWQEGTLPTCTTEGTQAHKDCTLCGKHFDNEGSEIVDITIAVDENAHVFGEWQEGTLPTCTTEGTQAHKDCTLCGKHFDNEGNEIIDITIAVDENAHAFGEWTTTTEPTCTTKGEDQRVCLHNGEHIEKRELDALGHNLVQHEGKTPTCTEIGWDAYLTCSRCDYTTYVELDALGHDFANEFTIDKQPTCKESGSKSKHCSRCDEKSEVTEIAKTAHSLTHIEANDASVEANGNVEYWSCSECESFFSDESGENEITDKTSVIIEALKPQQPSDEKENQGLSGGAIAGIVIGVLVFALITAYVVCYFVLYNKGKVLKGDVFDKIFFPMNKIFKKKN